MSNYENFPAQNMTARDEFTKAAMVAILSNPALTCPSDLRTADGRKHLAMHAISCADAALQALEDFK
jgi:hypothetical protein